MAEGLFHRGTFCPPGLDALDIHADLSPEQAELVRRPLNYLNAPLPDFEVATRQELLAFAQTTEILRRRAVQSLAFQANIALQMNERHNRAVAKFERVIALISGATALFYGDSDDDESDDSE